MIATPIEDFVWCDECWEPHPANFDVDPPVLCSDENMQCVPTKFVKELPSDWERRYYASYAVSRTGFSDGYDLMEMAPLLQPCHHAMYYLEQGSSE